MKVQAGHYILRNCVWLWLAWCAIIAAGILLNSWLILAPAIAAMIIAIPFAAVAAVHHVKRGLTAGRELFADFPQVWGNPRVPRALLGLIAYLLGLLLASGVLIKGLSRYFANHPPF